MALQIPGYRVVRKINQGGMSIVYLAIQISVGRVVALKVMNPQLTSDPAFSERFQREATIVGQLSHPNIVSIYDIGRHQDLNYIAMDYLPNGSVHDRMATGLTGEEVVRIVREVASALDHAHEKGYVHRDIKPENILFRTDNSAVLSDFGVARGLAVNSRMTHVGTVVGTPHYMSPEQAKGVNVDGRSDLYSLGIVFYEMLTGSLPYQGEEAVTVALKHISAPIPKLPMHYLIYQKIIDKLLAKDPEQRFQRGRDLIQALDDLEKIYLAPKTTGAHPSDLTVIALASALASASIQAIRWRWKRLCALRWSAERGFYTRPSTKITDIFYQQDLTPAARSETETKINTRVDQPPLVRRPGIILLALGLVLVAGIALWQLSSKDQGAELSPTMAQGVNPITAPTGSDREQAAAASIHSEATPSGANQAEANNIELSEGAPLALPDSQNQESESTLSPLDSESEAESSQSPVTYRLTVTTSPAQARVRVLNIPERYEPGMQLPAGAYHIEVSHPGYDMQRTWVDITDADLNPSYSLSQSIAPGDTMSSQLVTAINRKGPDMVHIASGSFIMGYKNDPLAMPVHRVTFNRGFAISKFEITFNDYDIFAQATKRPLPEDNRWGRGNRPVINVSFDDAAAYARWLSEITGKKYRLPTEAEWEYVARAKTNSLFWWGDESKDAAGRANCRRGCNSKFSGLFGAKTAPVGSYPANGFGVYDTAGNVAEWVQDCFVDNYNLHPKNGKALVVKSCDSRVVRGGSAKDNADKLASHIRDYHHAEIFDAHIGFRVVMEL